MFGISAFTQSPFATLPIAATGYALSLIASTTNNIVYANTINATINAITINATGKCATSL